MKLKERARKLYDYFSSKDLKFYFMHANRLYRLIRIIKFIGKIIGFF